MMDEDLLALLRRKGLGQCCVEVLEVQDIMSIEVFWMLKGRGEILKGGPVVWDACETVATVGAGMPWMQFKSSLRLVCVLSGVVGANQNRTHPGLRLYTTVIQWGFYCSITVLGPSFQCMCGFCLLQPSQK